MYKQVKLPQKNDAKKLQPGFCVWYQLLEQKIIVDSIHLFCYIEDAFYLHFTFS